MTEPLFAPGQSAVVTLGGDHLPCRVFGREDGRNARGFVGTPWVYYVIPEGWNFGLNVAEDAVRTGEVHSMHTPQTS